MAIIFNGVTLQSSSEGGCRRTEWHPTTNDAHAESAPRGSVGFVKNYGVILGGLGYQVWYRSVNIQSVIDRLNSTVKTIGRLQTPTDDYRDMFFDSFQIVNQIKQFNNQILLEVSMNFTRLT